MVQYAFNVHGTSETFRVDRFWYDEIQLYIVLSTIVCLSTNKGVKYTITVLFQQWQNKSSKKLIMHIVLSSIWVLVFFVCFFVFVLVTK